MNVKNQDEITAIKLFTTFTALGLRGFGGVMPYVHSALVENKKWLSNEEFSELIVIGQILPGANVTNFAAMFGYRRCGWRGSLAAVLGILVPPFLVLLVIYHFFKIYAELAVIKGALKGMLAVASALVLMTAFKLVVVQAKRVITILLSILCVILSVYFKLPLFYIILVLFPLGALVAWRTWK